MYMVTGCKLCTSSSLLEYERHLHSGTLAISSIGTIFFLCSVQIHGLLLELDHIEDPAYDHETSNALRPRKLNSVWYSNRSVATRNGANRCVIARSHAGKKSIADNQRLHQPVAMQ